MVKIDGFVCARKHKVIKTKRSKRIRKKKGGDCMGTRRRKRKFYDGCERMKEGSEEDMKDVNKNRRSNEIRKEG